MHVHFVIWVSVCLVYETVAVSRPSTMLFQNNQFTNVVVAFHDSIQEDKNLIDQLKDRVTKASQTLFKATRQRAYFKEIVILLPSSWSDDPSYGAPTTESIYQADVIITDNLRRKRGVHTRSYRGCGQQGVHVLLNKEFLTIPRASPYFNSPEKYFTHAFAQFRWGVFQEYAEEGESQFYISLTTGMPQAIRCAANMRGLVQKNDANHTICYSEINPDTGLFSDGCIWRPYPYRQPIKASMMDYQFINEIETFCDDNQTDRATVHNYEAPSKHNRLCEHRSTWDVIQNSVDFAGGINPPTSASVSQLTPTFRILKAKSRKRRAVISLDASILKKDGIEKTVTNLGRLKREADSHSIPLSLFLVKNNRVSEHHIKSTDDVKVLKMELLSSKAQFLSCQQMSQVQDRDANVVSVCDHRTSSDIATGVVIPGQTTGHTLLDKLRHSVFTNPASQDLLVMIKREDFQIYPGMGHTDIVHVDKLIDSEPHFIFHYEQTSPLITVQSPSGVLYTSKNATVSDDIKEVLFVCMAEPGQWIYKILSHDNQTVSLTVTATKTKAMDNLDLRLVLDKPESSVTYFQIFVDVTHFHHPVIGLNVTAVIETPSHHRHWLQLYDNGAGADISRDDGVYSRYFTEVQEPGHYHVTATVFGGDGQVFRKEESFEGLTPNGIGNTQKSIIRANIDGTLQRHVGGQSIYVSTEDEISIKNKDNTPPCRITDLSVKKHILYRNTFIVEFTAPGDDMDSGKVATYEVFIGEPSYGLSIPQFVSYTKMLMQEGQGQISRKIYNATKVAMETEYILYRTKNSPLTKSLIFGVVGVDQAGNRGKVSNIVIASTN